MCVQLQKVQCKGDAQQGCNRYRGCEGTDKGDWGEVRKAPHLQLPPPLGQGARKVLGRSFSICILGVQRSCLQERLPPDAHSLEAVALAACLVHISAQASLSTGMKSP